MLTTKIYEIHTKILIDQHFSFQKICKICSKMSVLISFAFYLASVIVVVSSWTPDVATKLYIKYDQEKLPMFYGNLTDYFKILDQDDFTLLIGARNYVYNVSLFNLLENQKERIEWHSSDAHRELCALKGKQDMDCQNYIRVYARLPDNRIMICGTNSYKPLCRIYAKHTTDDGTGKISTATEMINELEAQGRCPYNPTHNSTYVYTDGQLYSATVADFSGADPLIYRETQRTEQYDLKQLNQPAFVSALEHNGYVFFFFREIAMEYMNCGKTIYSRIARVCKNDKGGPYKFIDRWTSFLKTRLNCSVPGEYPFYFDEIQATSKIINGLYNNGDKRQSIIYAVFTTPTNAIPGSAICAFKMNDIMEAFEGRFKTQKDSTSNWLPVPSEAVPEPRPGKCVDDSRTLPSISVNFMKTHTLMDQSVPAMFGGPLLTRVNLKHRFTAITVDPQILSMNSNTYDVIFVGTDDGRVIKFVNIMSINDTEEVEPVVITETQALPHGMAIKELTVSSNTQSLIVVGTGHIVSIPLHHCSKIVRCRDCFNLQDPYCVWDVNNHECTSLLTNPNIHTNPDGFIQNMSGVDVIDLCKKYGDSAGNWIDPPPPIVIQSTRGTVSSVGRMPPHVSYDNEITVTSIDGVELTNQINNIHKTHIDPLVKEQLGGGGAENAEQRAHLGSASVITLMCILFVFGLFIGFFVAKMKWLLSLCYRDHHNQINAYEQKRHMQPLNSAKKTNLLISTATVPTNTSCNIKKDNLEQEFAKDRSHECKNSTENLEKEVNCKTGTLQKVKKTYI